MKDMKKKYPVSFSSELASGKIGKKSIVGKMQSQFDDAKRPKRKTDSEKEAPAIKAAYGCVKWRCAALPQGETEESLKERQETLKSHFETIRPRSWDWKLIETNMNLTYGQQRKDINKQAEEIENARKKLLAEKRKRARNKQQQPEPEQEDNVDDIFITKTEDIRNEWPFLFLPKCMVLHFQTLTGKDIIGSLKTYFEDDGQGKVLEFLFETNKDRKSSKKIKRRMEKEKENLPPHNAELIALLQLLLKRFNEKDEALWMLVDALATDDDIPILCKIPKTPRLFIAGQSILKPQKIFYSMDGQVLGTAESLLDGIGLLFGAYFVFNLNYDAEAQITLEFIQRCIMMTNVPRGNRRPRKEAGGYFSAKTVHPSLVVFDSKFEEFLAEKQGSSSSQGSGES